jgi:hypothetical protein
MNRLCFAFSIVLATCLLSVARADDKQPVDFDRDIRPILSNHCFACHGPDAEKRESGFRLDMRASAIGEAESGAHPIVPGDVAQSELVTRVFSDDDDVKMPPPELNKPLSAEQKDLLKRWVAAGAPYEKHWAFVAPRRPALPVVKDKAWPRNAIDDFILARLEREGLTPSPPAERFELLRRVTFDLTGLPPTPAEVAAFLADESPDAYGKVVQRLLDSPHFGERLAVDWLDAARFADTHGYHIDSGRDMTRWREWVIDAFNSNLPFDQFTIEQLAGDLLPNATLEQKVASGFNRNHMINFEGGAIPQEYHNAYLVDRVNTTSTVWLGLTVACSQCHDHKFDPLTQREYYQFYAFFHNVPENGLDGSRGNAAPMIKAPTREQTRELADIQTQLANLRTRLTAASPEADNAQQAWEATALREDVVNWTTLTPVAMKATGGATLASGTDQFITATGKNAATEHYVISAEVNLAEITAIRLETGVDGKLNGSGPGRSVNGNVVLTDVKLSAGDQHYPFRRATADFSQADYPVQNAVDANPSSGWAIYPEVGKPHAAVFELAKPIGGGEKVRLTIELAFDSQFAQHQPGVFRLSVTDAKQPHGDKHIPANVVTALQTESSKRTAEQSAALRSYYREQVSPEFAALRDSLTAAIARQAEIEKQIPTTMVMQEMAKPRDTFVLLRGQYDKPGEKVVAEVPAALPPLPEGAPHNRLGLAQWLVDPQHPLTSRVIVNRYWQLIFGTGLVKTVEDFGAQGEAPSHPELLDYLAVEFMSPAESNNGQAGRQAWDVKELLRLMVTSSTYRQAARVTPALVERDPKNRLLARGPRMRLQAEFIRDQALAISGLLNQKIGGESVSPYQPPGLWSELASRADGKNWTAQEYTQSHGEDLYRRTMYTFWKRTSPPPQLVTFDAPDRETCTVRRARTNTPLQALILLNDPTYVEASRKLAERMLKEGDETAVDRLKFAFVLATTREPSAHELGVLQKVLARYQAKYAADRAAATALLAVGESPRDESLSEVDVASYAIAASVILNLDETVSK